jgi:hypothetical protein
MATFSDYERMTLGALRERYRRAFRRIRRAWPGLSAEEIRWEIRESAAPRCHEGWDEDAPLTPAGWAWAAEDLAAQGEARWSLAHEEAAY